MKIITDITLELNSSDATIITKMIDMVAKHKKLSGDEMPEVVVVETAKDIFTVHNRIGLLEVARAYESAAFSLGDGMPDTRIMEFARYLKNSKIDHPRHVLAYNETKPVHKD